MLQVMHYDLRCGTGMPDANTRARGSSSSSNGAQGGSSRSGARRKLLACRGYTRARGLTREVRLTLCSCGVHAAAWVGWLQGFRSGACTQAIVLVPAGSGHLR
jgi:hypothetical protein